ncbi:MAG TPA: hypothetical protein VNO18_15650 [Xanthobacteraceae bacterium]|nr:hypothetical protein [Xanthobacteraceae bacterium]
MGPTADRTSVTAEAEPSKIGSLVPRFGVMNSAADRSAARRFNATVNSSLRWTAGVDKSVSLNCPALQANGLESVNRARGGSHSHHNGLWNPWRTNDLINSTTDEGRDADAPPVTQNFSRETVETDLLALRQRGGYDPGCLDKSKMLLKRAGAAR